MILRMTVRDAATLASQDIEVTAEPASTVASLLAALPLATADNAVYLGATRLDPESTIGDSPLVRGAVLSVGAPGVDHRAPPSGVVGSLSAVAGPDAGLVTWLPPGRHTVARDAGASVPLRDPDASRRHVLLDVSPDGRVAVADVGSTNGTWVGGA